MRYVCAILLACVWGDQIASLHSSSTSYIEDQTFAQSRDKPVSKHESSLCSNKQVSGYLSVPGGDTLFYIFFEAIDATPDTPVSLWINGGPGSSSLLGAFNGIGPCIIDNTGENVIPNQFSWTRDTHLLVLDQVTHICALI
ncbi:hypothetical protein DSO57_1004732 [Entomophthora muscae]|uniref:Uncharacterized protein n=1 Tax=Entomophthora muscae TaxID=34485 RepID=A0ACC2TJD7_9FUNG|nr:hypothetical protein DSO57_1004732 [Entomophthora muscae]